MRSFTNNLLHISTVAYQKCYPKVNSQAYPGWIMSGTLQFQAKLIAATFLIVRFLTFVSKLTTFLKTKAQRKHSFFIVQKGRFY